MKATVTLKEGFRYHRLDNSFVDLAEGDVVETDDIPPFERGERLRDGHLKPVPEPKATHPHAAHAAPESFQKKK